MAFIRKTLKAYIIVICVFILLTLLLAVLLRFTAFDEDWSFIGLVVVLSVTTLLLGIMEGNVIGKRGLLAGIVSAAVFLAIILLAVGSVFAGTPGKESIHVSYLIPLLSGAVGGILGANSRKS